MSCSPFTLLPVVPEMVSNRIFIWEELFYKSLIDDRNHLRRGGVLLDEPAAANHGLSHSLEEMRTHAVP